MFLVLMDQNLFVPEGNDDDVSKDLECNCVDVLCSLRMLFCVSDFPLGPVPSPEKEG